MRRPRWILLLVFLLITAPAYPYWIWTPKTGKWVNPKTDIKPNPKAQLDFAMSLYDIKKYEDAKRELKKLIQSYPKSAEAAEGQYYLGLVDEAEDNPYEAFLDFQKVIDKYPFSERIQEIIERQYNIGTEFMAGKKRKAFGVTLPVDNPAIEIFGKVVENSAYGPLAAGAQYKLGLVLKALQRYYEAEEAFGKVVSNYPNSEWAQPAKFQIASCRAATSKGPEYDQGAANEAKEKFEEFLRSHPDAVLSEDAQKNIDGLQEKEAASKFNIAMFYEKQKAYASARIYYEDVINNYAQSQWAGKATERLSTMEKAKK